MKRVSENAEGTSENSGFKKVRFFNGIHEGDGVLEKTQGDEERVFTENGMIGSAEIDRNGVFFGNEVAGDFGSASLGVLKQADNWDFDINFDLIFGDEEQQKGLGFDLNVPVFETCSDDTKKGFQEFTQEGPFINEKRVEIIEIVSDDSDDEVEIVGFSSGYKEKGKEIEVGVSYDRIENLNLGMEINKMDYFVGESSSVAGGEMRYTREEKGKASIVVPWLSLNGFYPIDLDLSDNEDSVEISESREDVEFIAWQPVALPAMSEEAELERRRAEQVFRHRVMANHAVLRETARRFARVSYPGENSRNESASQEKKSPAVKVVEQLGNSPGPFAEALKMVRERTSRRAAQHLSEWKPSEENRNLSITAPLVPSLLDLSLKALAKNAEGIVSLELVPDVLRRRLTDVLCDINRMSVHILNLLVKGYPTEIRIKNCSWLTEEQFQQTFGNCQTKNLRVLQLDLCGQCMLDLAFRDTLARSSYSFSSLAIVSLRGACRLSDSGLKELLVAAPALRSINLGQCTLLTCDGINFIADFLGSNLRELYIDDCQKINAMLTLLAFKKFEHLEVLSVAGIQTVTDQFISEVIIVCGQSIKELDMANCLELTDCSLKTIGSSCVDLHSLNISNLHNLTDLGLEYLANGCRSIQKLKLCRNVFSDEAMAAFLESSGGSLTELLLNNVTKVGPNTAVSLAKCSRKLLSLDLSWCRSITNEALGLIVDSCSSLKLLKVFGCKQITCVFINGHSNPLVRIIGLNVTPILENINLLEPEEVFLRYSPLPICPPFEIETSTRS